MKEERDKQRDKGVDCLSRELDMYPAIDCFAGLEFVVRFDVAGWMYQPT